VIARACGARVTKSPVAEAGFREVSLTVAALADPLLAGLPSPLTVLQWHEDAFSVPPDGVLLAEGWDCPKQAFRYRTAWGFQFHLEADREMIATWFSGHEDRDEILAEYDRLAPRLNAAAGRLFCNLVSHVADSRRSRSGSRAKAAGPRRT
jgi:GMP synthase (glutamine-hydrolysing)